MGGKVYPSDLSREQFEVIRAMLEGAKRRTTPRKQDLYDVFCTILYLLKNGCTWRVVRGLAQCFDLVGDRQAVGRRCLYGRTLCATRGDASESRGRDCHAQRTAPVCGDAKTVGC